MKKYTIYTLIYNQKYLFGDQTKLYSLKTYAYIINTMKYDVKSVYLTINIYI